MNTHSHSLSRGRRFRRLAVTAAAAPALLLGLSAATQAATTAHGARSSSPGALALPSCGTSTLCTFQDANFGGSRWNFAYSSRPHGTWFWVGSGANDQITSMYNHRAWISYLAEKCPADSNWAFVGGGQAVYNLNVSGNNWQDGHPMNDSISAIALGTSSTVHYPAHGSC